VGPRGRRGGTDLALGACLSPGGVLPGGVEGLRAQPGTMLHGDTLLFVAGSIEFFREEYKDADFLYSRIVEIYPNSPLVTRR
jgi:hypothetical protein